MYDIVEAQLQQKATTVDFNRIGQLSRAGMTAMVRQMMVPGLAFADFNFVVSGFQLTVSNGMVYKNGAQHTTLAPTPISFVGDTPPSAGLKRIVSIVAVPVAAHSDNIESREFAVVVTPATANAAAVYQTETRQTQTLNRQTLNIVRVLGDSAPQPTPPSIAADQCEIARVVLSQSGIDSVTPVEANRAPSLTALSGLVGDIQDFVDNQGKRIDTLDKNLAALAASIPIPVSEFTIRQLTSNVATLNEVTRVKIGDLSYGTDYALDKRWTDNSYIGYAATVQDGIRFPWVTSKEAPLSLYTPGDNGAKVVANLLLPAFTEEARVNVTGMDGSVSISNQVNTVTTAVQRTISRSSVSSGPPFTVCNNTAFWQSGNYDAANNLFTRAGETFTAVPTGVDFGAPVGYAPGSHIEFRLQQQWTDTWTETYWDQVTTTIGINGTIRAQTFRVPDFGYLTSIDLPFTTKDAAFGVTLLLLKASAGGPNLKQVVEKCDLLATDIVADATGKTRTKFTFRPVFVDPGVIYSWATVTKGNYALATVKGNKFAQGTSFNSTDQGDFFVGDVDVDFAFTANFAKFNAPRVELRLNDVDNTNGDVISAVRFLYGSIIPAGCQIVHMMQRSGGTWTAVATLTGDRTPPDAITAGPFSQLPLPASVQHKVVLVGTTTLMPAIDLTQAWVTALKLGNVMNHFTPVLNLGASCTRAEVQVTVDGPFDPVNHVNGCNLIVGGTTVAPTGKTTVIDPNKPGKRVFTYSFTYTASTSFRINLTGTINSLLSTYHVDNRFFRAWSA